MRLDVYVNYKGTCEQAFRFYEQHLGGKVVSMTKHGEVPNPNIPADWKNNILHARIEIGDTVLMGADIPSAEPMRSAYLALRVDSDAEADRIYALLSDGGEIFMKMEPRTEHVRSHSRPVAGRPGKSHRSVIPPTRIVID
jgi:PhnB protein